MELTLVLEDYHILENEEIYIGVNFLLDNLPQGLHVVLTTRSDPPLNLARRRGRGQINELRAADLRFTPEETLFFLNQIMQLDLADEDVAALSNRTEGWIAGLQMAALSLQDESDRHVFVRAFSGDDRYIADYLIEEVLQRQPLDFQRFLLETSILDRLNAPLCDFVTNRQDSRAMVNALERANLFILPLDNRREWFRYHHLFAELLQRRLTQVDGEEAVKALQRRAVDWFHTNGYFNLAIQYALNLSDYQLAAKLIISTGNKFFIGNELNTLLNLGARLPAEQIAGNYTLGCMLAWAAHATGHPQKAEEFIHQIENQAGKRLDDLIGQQDDPHLDPHLRAALIEMSVVRARIAVDRFEIDRTFRLVEKVLPVLVPERDREPFAFNPPSQLRGPMVFILGLARKLHGDISLAAEDFAESVSEGRRAQNLHIVALALGHLGEVQMI